MCNITGCTDAATCLITNSERTPVSLYPTRYNWVKLILPRCIRHQIQGAAAAREFPIHKSNAKVGMLNPAITNFHFEY